jgi:5-methylcytosine-specific restriction endonuclease McrA
MKFTDPRNGREVEVSVDLCQEFSREYYGNAFHCEHVSLSAPRIFLNSNDTRAIHSQCLRCGDRVGQAMKKGTRAEPFDLTISINFEAMLAAEHERLTIKYIDLQREADVKNSRTYKEHLQSARWRELRDLVIQRCGNRCEGCGVNPVEEVHHWTYDRLGNEFLFDLAGLCGACHRRFHKKDEGEATSAI